ncbi:MAG: hypothetical protein ACSHYA_07565 [Opitutaceae bacterium]
MNRWLSISSITVCLFPQIAPANTAVSSINGKLGGAYVQVDSETGVIAEGSLALPLGESLGFQFDGLYSAVDDDDTYGFGAHFFWRKNDQGLVGLTAGALLNESVDAFEVSLEAEYYFERVTLGAKLGWASIEYDRAVVFIETDRDSIAAKLYGTVYPHENLAVTLALEHRYENPYASLDVEYELPSAGWSLFGSVASGAHDFDSASVGLRYYFGGSNTLKARHRSDDPKNVIHDIRNGADSYQAEYHERRVEYIEKLEAGCPLPFSTGLIARDRIVFSDGSVIFDSYDSSLIRVEPQLGIAVPVQGSTLLGYSVVQGSVIDRPVENVVNSSGQFHFDESLQVIESNCP